MGKGRKGGEERGEALPVPPAEERTGPGAKGANRKARRKGSSMRADQGAPAKSAAGLKIKDAKVFQRHEKEGDAAEGGVK